MISRDELLSVLHDTPCLHNGGCLVASYCYYYNELRHDRGQGLNIVSLHFSDDDLHYINNNDFVLGLANIGTSAPHFGWSYDNGVTVHDVSSYFGEREIELESIFPERIAIPQSLTDRFYATAMRSSNWNWMFDRAFFVSKFAELFDMDNLVELSAIDVYNSQSMMDW